MKIAQTGFAIILGGLYLTSSISLSAIDKCTHCERTNYDVLGLTRRMQQPPQLDFPTLFLPRLLKQSLRNPKLPHQSPIISREEEDIRSISLIHKHDDSDSIDPHKYSHEPERPLTL
jgi:hypothetical protein